VTSYIAPSSLSGLSVYLVACIYLSVIVRLRVHARVWLGVFVCMQRRTRVKKTTMTSIRATRNRLAAAAVTPSVDANDVIYLSNAHTVKPNLFQTVTSFPVTSKYRKSGQFDSLGGSYCFLGLDILVGRIFVEGRSPTASVGGE